jgi:hypothetical protein
MVEELGFDEQKCGLVLVANVPDIDIHLSLLTHMEGHESTEFRA